MPEFSFTSIVKNIGFLLSLIALIAIICTPSSFSNRSNKNNYLSTIFPGKISEILSRTLYKKYITLVALAVSIISLLFIVIIILTNIERELYNQRTTISSNVYSNSNQTGFNSVSNNNSSSSNENKYWSSILAFSGGGVFTILCGTVLMGFSRSNSSKTAGFLLIVSGLAINGYLIKEINIENFFKLEQNSNTKIKYDDNPHHKYSEFGPQFLGSVENFDSGSKELKIHMSISLEKICESWRNHGANAQQGLLLLIGSTDRTRLNTATSAQYESNSGLARARSEQVKDYLHRCGLPHHQMLTLTSGPKFTPEQPGALDEEQASMDRSVTVWALWSFPASSGRDGW